MKKKNIIFLLGIFLSLVPFNVQAEEVINLIKLEVDQKQGINAEYSKFAGDTNNNFFNVPLNYKKNYAFYNWVSYVEKDPYGMKDINDNDLVVPYSDPPPGGYEYNSADVYPYYWDIVKGFDFDYLLKSNQQTNNVEFKDYPADYRLQNNEEIVFLTHLVGVKDYYKWDALYSFRWRLVNNNGNQEVEILDTNISLNEISPSVKNLMIEEGGEFKYSTSFVVNTN